MRELLMIFISYRRKDAAGHAGRLFDRLGSRYGRSRVFMDVDTIKPGQDYQSLIDERVGTSDALIVLIGDQWLTVTDERGRRLDNPDDPVRMEIASALNRGIPVFPVLVEATPMPRAEELPEVLRPLTRLQALGISDSRFDDESEELMHALEARLGIESVHRKARRRDWILLALGLGCGVTGLGYWIAGKRRAGARRDLTGRWKGTATASRGQMFMILFEFVELNGELSGSVEYPTGSGLVKSGHVRGERVEFATEHVPQFADAPAIIRYDGFRVGDELRLRMATSDTVREVVATRVPPM